MKCIHAKPLTAQHATLASHSSIASFLVISNTFHLLYKVLFILPSWCFFTIGLPQYILFDETYHRFRFSIQRKATRKKLPITKKQPRRYRPVTFHGALHQETRSSTPQKVQPPETTIQTYENAHPIYTSNSAIVTRRY